jgi:hypothetical protein
MNPQLKNKESGEDKVDVASMMMLMLLDKIVKPATREEMELKPGEEFSLLEYRRRLAILKKEAYVPDAQVTTKVGKITVHMATLVTTSNFYIGMEIPDTEESLLTHLYRKADLYNFSAYISPYLEGHRDQETDKIYANEMTSAVSYGLATLIDMTASMEHLGSLFGASWLVLTDDKTPRQIVPNSRYLPERVFYTKKWLERFIYDVDSMWRQHDLMHYLSGDNKIQTIGEIDHG